MHHRDNTARAVSALLAQELTIAVAESLTGGLVTAELTSIPGASGAVLGGVIVYATELKNTVLGVDSALLTREGPVHPEVACQLAYGVRHRLAVHGRPADIGLATTGVAGPDPQGGRPVGTVYVGISSPTSTRAVELFLRGDRESIRAQTVEHLIGELCCELGCD